MKNEYQINLIGSSNEVSTIEYSFCENFIRC